MKKANSERAPISASALPRGPHPSDPGCKFFSATHQPLPLPHEKFGGLSAGRSAQEPVEVALVTKKTVEKVKSSTGLVTLDDFVREATLAGVCSEELVKGMAKAFEEAPSEGMRRMRAGNLLRNAVKRAIK